MSELHPLFTVLCICAYVGSVSGTSLFGVRQGTPQGHFLHGVASGDPLDNAIILWTRITPVDETTKTDIPVQWLVWEETEVAPCLHNATQSCSIQPRISGQALAHHERDFTVKVDVREGLRTQIDYVYGFEAGAARSPYGRFRLPPPAGTPLETLRYAIFSCANRVLGTFAAYGAAADHGPLDFWLHLGDYYYEYGPDPSGEGIPGLQPNREVTTLQDYRRRHAFYRLDPDLQRLSASAPVIAIWDDHEVANDAWMNGAENHQPGTEGPFRLREAAAVRAYHEWLPTRPEFDPFAKPPAGSTIAEHMPWMRWRRFDFGSLATLLMLETRLIARTTQSKMTGDAVEKEILDILRATKVEDVKSWGNATTQMLSSLRDTVEDHRQNLSKRILGDEQLQWLDEQVSAGGSAAPSRWLLVGQPLVVQELMSPNFEQAIRIATSSGDQRIALEWAQALHNSTTVGATYIERAHSPLMPLTPRHERNVTAESRDRMLIALAAGRFGIQLDFDSWTGHVAERERLAQVLRKARQDNPERGVIIYGGDSHNAWAGILRTQREEAAAVDFDTMSVTSHGLESERPWLPPAFEAAAWRAANPGLAWADTSNRGFMLVNLELGTQHLEYIAVDVGSPGSGALRLDRSGRCLAAFEVHPSALELHRTKCKQGRP